MRHPLEIFDTADLRLMSEALQSAIATARLSGREPSAQVETEMARRLIRAAKDGRDTKLSLTEAALDGGW